MKLRDYQQGIKQGIVASLRAGNKKIIAFGPTGSGKTVVAVNMIGGALKKGNRSWFIVDSIELIQQALSTLDNFGIHAAVMQGQHPRTDISNPVQVMTAQTLTRRWKYYDARPEYLPDLVIVDEAHVVYKAHKEIFNQHRTKDVPVIGFSATPYTKGLGRLYDDIVIGTSTAQLTADGHLVPVIAYGCKTIDTKGVGTDNKGDYLTKPLAKKITTITGDIVKTWFGLGENRQTLVYCVNVAHSKELCVAFISAGVVAHQIDGYTPAEERSDAIAAFKRGDIKMLVSVGTLVKGFDAPNASCLVMARPTKSKMLHFQILGRVLRTYKGKENAIILDHGGSVAKIGFPEENTPDSLDDGTKGNSNDRTKKKKDARTCPKCGQILTSNICLCGYSFSAEANVEYDSGELEKLSAKDRRNKSVSHEDKQAFYSGALQYCYYNGKKEGYAANLYRSRFGVWPNKYVKIRKPHIPPEVLNQVKANNIRYAKRRK